MSGSWKPLAASLAYMLVMGLLSYYAKRYSKNAHGFTSGGTYYPAILVGFLLMSEFIGTTASVGTAQAAYKWGISAAWNMAALGIGFMLYAFLFAKKFKELGENTISAVIDRNYGHTARISTSLIMICALQIVAVSVYGSGGAVVSQLLNIDRTTAIVGTGIVAVLYVGMGGMSSVIYTNVLHAIFKYVGIIVAVAFAVSQVGGMAELRAKLPPQMFSVDHVGWSQIFAWILAGTGAVFSTQYVIQAVSTVESGAKARIASIYTSLLLIPFGIGAAVVGMCAAVLFPKINALQAFPMVLAQMDETLASIVVIGLVGSLFGTISAISIGTATLLYKDFYIPLFKHRGDDQRALFFVRSAAVVVGLLPIPIALFAPDVLKVTFLAKSLRLTLAVLVLLLFYAPGFGTRRGATISILGSLVLTIGWYVIGEPWGIDNAYVALVIPLVVMTASQILRGKDAAATVPVKETP